DDTWDPPGTFAQMSKAIINQIAATVAKHPLTEDVYVGDTTPQWARWTQATDTWTQIKAPCFGGYKGGVIDAGRNRLLLCLWQTDTTFGALTAIDLSTMQATR